jgi:STE24 endopeptidase
VSTPSILFLALLLSSTGTRLWLAWRQIRHVRCHAHQVPPAFADTISLQSHQRAAQYTQAKQQLALAQILTDALAFAILTWGGVLDTLYHWLLAHAGNGMGAELALVGVSTLLLSVVDLPFDLWRTFHIDQRFGFNRSSPGLFVADLLKSTAIVIVIGAPLLAVVLYLMQHAGAGWWFETWVVWSLFSLTLTVLYPVLIAPLFNRFTPLNDPALRDRIDQLLTRTGFRNNGVFTMDGSRRSSHGNAYFTGLGSAKRIVFFDTLIERLRPEEIEAVLAHELGHFRLNHIRQGLILALFSSLAALALMGYLAGNPVFFQALGVQTTVGQPTNALLLILVTLVLPQATLLLAPMRSAYSRRHEFEADAFAARHANGADLIRALVKLYQDNAATLTPDPWHSRFHDSHPPASVRIQRLQQTGVPVNPARS